MVWDEQEFNGNGGNIKGQWGLEIRSHLMPVWALRSRAWSLTWAECLARGAEGWIWAQDCDVVLGDSKEGERMERGL